MKAVGASAAEIDIRPAAHQLLADLGHPFAHGEPVHDVTFENVQAGLRTDYLFRLANHHNALVVGTGDLSELGLGWCTYGVGDHMSHYNVNASVPKTLIQHLIRFVASSGHVKGRQPTFFTRSWQPRYRRNSYRSPQELCRSLPRRPLALMHFRISIPSLSPNTASCLPR